MEKQAAKEKPGRLSDAYKARGFRVREVVDSYELDRPVFVLTLDGIPKKRRRADAAASGATGYTIRAGVAHGISVAGIGKSIWTFRCAA